MSSLLAFHSLEIWLFILAAKRCKESKNHSSVLGKIVIFTLPTVKIGSSVYFDAYNNVTYSNPWIVRHSLLLRGPSSFIRNTDHSVSSYAQFIKLVVHSSGLYPANSAMSLCLAFFLTFSTHGGSSPLNTFIEIPRCCMLESLNGLKWTSPTIQSQETNEGAKSVVRMPSLPSLYSTHPALPDANYIAVYVPAEHAVRFRGTTKANPDFHVGRLMPTESLIFCACAM